MQQNNVLYLNYTQSLNPFSASTAKYYNQSGDTIDLIPTVSSLLGVPCSILAAYVVCRFGLKTGLYVGSIFTGIGRENKNKNKVKKFQ